MIAEDVLSSRLREISAAERARWLAELSEVLKQTHELTSELGFAGMQDAEAVELCARLAAARAQVNGLQLSRSEDRSQEPDPEWRHPPAWPSGANKELQTP
jgi:hypothetical protein